MPANIQVSLRLLAIPAQSWMLHRSKNFRWPLPIPKSDRARHSLRSSRELMLAACGRRAGISPDRHPAANRAVQHLRRPLDALGGGVQHIRDRGLGLTRAVDGGDADVTQPVELLLEVADARIGIEQLV